MNSQNLLQKLFCVSPFSTRKEREREMVGSKRPIFVLFGSSIVQFSFSEGGWGSILADTYSRQADVVLRGYAGWNSRQALKVLPKVFPIDAMVQPSLVIVYFGGNDSTGPHPLGLSPHVPLDEYVNNMRNIGLHVTGLSEKTRVIFLSCPPIRASTYDKERNIANETRRIYSDACIKMCNEMNFQVIDMFNAIQTHEDWANVCFTDGVHFSAEASDIVAKSILNAINEANWEPSLYYEDLPVEFQDVPF